MFVLALVTGETHADLNDLVHGGIVPLHVISSSQWIERVAGDMDKPGEPFVIRIPMTPVISFCRTRIQKTRTLPY